MFPNPNLSQRCSLHEYFLSTQTNKEKVLVSNLHHSIDKNQPEVDAYPRVNNHDARINPALEKDISKQKIYQLHIHVKETLDANSFMQFTKERT
jgi:hypothetical protein